MPTLRLQRHAYQMLSVSWVYNSKGLYGDSGDLCWGYLKKGCCSILLFPNLLSCQQQKVAAVASNILGVSSMVFSVLKLLKKSGMVSKEKIPFVGQLCNRIHGSQTCWTNIIPKDDNKKTWQTYRCVSKLGWPPQIGPQHEQAFQQLHTVIQQFIVRHLGHIKFLTNEVPFLGGKRPWPFDQNWRQTSLPSCHWESVPVRGFQSRHWAPESGKHGHRKRPARIYRVPPICK